MAETIPVRAGRARSTKSAAAGMSVEVLLFVRQAWNREKGSEPMAKDPLSERFEERQKKAKLRDLSRRARPEQDVEAEEELVKKTEKVRPLNTEYAAVGRNDPGPCGSGWYNKKCCGAKE